MLYATLAAPASTALVNKTGYAENARESAKRATLYNRAFGFESIVGLLVTVLFEKIARLS